MGATPVGQLKKNNRQNSSVHIVRNRYLQAHVINQYIDVTVIDNSIRILFNLFMPNGISHRYRLEQSISVLRVAGWYFHLYSNFNRTPCKQSVENLIRRRVLCLIWVCTVCRCPTKRTLGLNMLIRCFTSHSTIFRPCQVIS